MTDSSGTVVYAAAHEPYGGIQKTWVSTYDPSLKFSGKQRDAESDLDYFGARYYDRSQYRFVSVDPVMNSPEIALAPHRWNLYTYCRNNPLSFVDPSGGNEIYCFVFLNLVPWDQLVSKLNPRAVGSTSPFVRVYETLDGKGGTELSFLLYFRVRVGEPGHINYEAVVDEIWPEGAAAGVFAHEMQHVVDVAMYFRWKGAQIERDWRAKRISLEEAQKRADAALETAVKISTAIRDNYFGLASRLFAYGDPFWSWVGFVQIMDINMIIISEGQ